MELSKLGPRKGAKRSRTRLGLGEGSGHGKTAGRGGKGQTARTGGGTRPGFEGGQMPFSRRLPKFGFTSIAKLKGRNVYSVINLSDLNRFESGATVDEAALRTLGMVRGKSRTAGVKVLGKGELTKKLTVKVNAISEAAKAKIEASGGSVELITK